VVPEEKEMEDVVVSGVAFNRSEAKITMLSVPDHPGIAAEVFGAIGEAGIVVDMIIQNVAADEKNDISFTVSRADYDKALKLAKDLSNKFGGRDVVGDPSIAKVSAVGVGMRSHADVASKMFKALSEKGINIQSISTSEIKISALIAEEDLDEAVRAVHEAFQDQKVKAKKA
jgi:aspartate kinase